MAAPILNRSKNEDPAGRRVRQVLVRARRRRDAAREVALPVRSAGVRQRALATDLAQGLGSTQDFGRRSCMLVSKFANISSRIGRSSLVFGCITL